ncbi:multidrug efflux pump [Desulfonatronum thiosulfatophilum]|uniref:Multidrug efflux pump n=1 Tax=Desulfonatronum thiosulfatophilum TaxID=617002 RepID=A0A1G6E8U0_9BACT|nr:efflux RND transporter permease subunit [Desulfonatronum thiosulfatophilum]SDB53778.1 multidrug efflux pump [Desulfonatronum thiosulfatophilum]
MNAILAGLLGRGRTLLLLLLLLLTAGGAAYVIAPKEAAPDIDIPIFFVTVVYPGVSAEDSERLLLQPLERELQQLAGLDELVSNAGEGFGIIRLEFLPGFESRTAMLDVQQAVDVAAPELPAGAEQPVVNEVNLDLFPILSIVLSGPMEERSLLQVARNLRDRLEGIDGVLQVDIIGERDEVMEILVDPTMMETYQISFQELAGAVERNNQLVPAGSVHAGAGRIGIIVPGTIENMEDVRNIAVRVEEGIVITVDDVAEVREGFVDPERFARIDGEPALTLDVRPRTGANVLITVDAVLRELEQAQQAWPEALRVTLLQNQAEQIENLLGDLENTVIIAVLLVSLTIIAVMGLRAALLVAVAVPGAFLTGILVIYAMGFTLNIVVLFALILVVGMLVDGAIVVVELADRYIKEGRHRREAFLLASQRMAWPIISAAATSIAVFVPMLFWPGMIGEFIIYLPATVIITLLASLLMALVFVPALGQVLGPRSQGDDEKSRRIKAAETGDYQHTGKITARYVEVLGHCCRRPVLTLAGGVGLVLCLYLLYGVFGRGVEFFPDIEPETLQVRVHARGDLSVWEADDLVRQVEQRLAGLNGVEAVNTQAIADQQLRLQQNLPADTIGVIRLELLDWRQRPKAAEISAAVRQRTRDLPGLRVLVRDEGQGPARGLPIVVELSGEQRPLLFQAVSQARTLMEELGGFAEIQDDLPVPGVELRLIVDREEAARYGANVLLLGQSVQMLTAGVVLGVYRPAHSDEEVDIRMRFPLERRNMEELARLRVPTVSGMVPITNFVRMEPAPATGVINRINGRPAYRIEADAASGYQVNEQIRRLDQALQGAELPEGVDFILRGQAEDQAESANFLRAAFLVSIFLMFLILVTQFNSLLQAALVMSAIVFSTAGVLLGLLVRGEPFNIVMSGIGILALAGIVVNNNIVLIDHYNRERRRGLEGLEAALRTGAQRMRPVVLTAVTTILGLLPMVLGLTIDFLERDIYFGAPATQYWIALSTAIVGGLIIATPLTLLFTPAMLAWMDRRGKGNLPRGEKRHSA